MSSSAVAWRGTRSWESRCCWAARRTARCSPFGTSAPIAPRRCRQGVSPASRAGRRAWSALITAGGSRPTGGAWRSPRWSATRRSNRRASRCGATRSPRARGWCSCSSPPTRAKWPHRRRQGSPEIARGRPRLVERRVFEAHVDHAVVGLMDPAHGPFVHRQWWWRTRASAHAKAKAFRADGRGLRDAAPCSIVEFPGVRPSGWRAADRDHLPPAPACAGSMSWSASGRCWPLTCLTPDRSWAHGHLTQLVWVRPSGVRPGRPARAPGDAPLPAPGWGPWSTCRTRVCVTTRR